MELKESPQIGIGVIVLKENRVLLGKRKGAHGSGEWAFPGGHLEFKESPEECAFRELLEETGLEGKTIEGGPWTNDIINNQKHYVTLFMFVKEFLGEPEVLEPHKCEEWNWFEWDHLPQPLFLPVSSLIEKMGIESLKAITLLER